MMSPVEIEQLLQRLGDEWAAECSLINRVRRRIDAESVAIQPWPAGFPAIRWLMATAASVVVVVALWWAFHGEGTLYAQAINGLKEARTVSITATGRSAPDKPEEIVRKAWYERGVGFREELGSDIRFGNQKNFWTFLKDSNLAIRSKSRGLDKIVNRMLDSDELREFKEVQKTERYPDADQAIDGRRCQAYLLTYVYPLGYPANLQHKDDKQRTLIFLDDRSRLVRSLRQLQTDDGWRALNTVDFKYDVPVTRELFDPKFGEEVKIVDADEVFDEFVNLDKAVYHEERAGLVFAIHRLQRFQDGIYVVSSVRGTEKTLKKYPLKRRVSPSSVFEEGPAANYEASPQGSGYFRIDLARADYEGINVCWWVLVPRGAPLSRFNIAPGMVKLPMAITPHGDFAKDNFSKNGVIQHLYWDLVLSLPERAAWPSTELIAAEAYADQIALEAIPFRRLDMGPKDNVEQFSQPERTTAVEFANAVVAHIRHWRKGDVDFQLEGQFGGAMGGANGAIDADRAIGLSYEPTVDDATLARVAKREAIKRLYLDGTKITDAGLKQLGGLKQLRELSLAHTTITDAGLKELEGLASLRELNVKDTKVSSAGISQLKKAFPELNVEH